MNSEGHIAAEVQVATRGQFPEEILAIIGEYATLLRAGDWCLMKVPTFFHRNSATDEDDKGYKIGVIKHVVEAPMYKNGVVREVIVHECGREISGERDAYEDVYRKRLDDMDAARGPMETLHAPKYKGRNPYVNNGENMNVYTDSGRVPFGWIKPVMVFLQFNKRGEARGNNTCRFTHKSLEIVAAGKRGKIEALFKNISPSKKLPVEGYPTDEDFNYDFSPEGAGEAAVVEGEPEEEPPEEKEDWEEDAALESAEVEEDAAQGNCYMEESVVEENAGVRMLRAKRKRQDE
jgi:hypothetical protein